MSVRWLPLLLIGWLALPGTPAARQARLAFDVTSVKPSVPPEPDRFGFPIAPSMQFRADGFAATQATLRDLVRRAYALPDFRIIGGPDRLQEQLGLKLEAGRAPVDVLVIDGASRPVAN